MSAEHDVPPAHLPPSRPGPYTPPTAARNSSGDGFLCVLCDTATCNEHQKRERRNVVYAHFSQARTLIQYRPIVILVWYIAESLSMRPTTAEANGTSEISNHPCSTMPDCRLSRNGQLSRKVLISADNNVQIGRGINLVSIWHKSTEFRIIPLWNSLPRIVVTAVKQGCINSGLKEKFLGL